MTECSAPASLQIALEINLKVGGQRRRRHRGACINAIGVDSKIDDATACPDITLPSESSRICEVCGTYAAAYDAFQTGTNSAVCAVQRMTRCAICFEYLFSAFCCGRQMSRRRRVGFIQCSVSPCDGQGALLVG